MTNPVHSDINSEGWKRYGFKWYVTKEIEPFRIYPSELLISRIFRRLVKFRPGGRVGVQASGVVNNLR